MKDESLLLKSESLPKSRAKKGCVNIRAALGSWTVWFSGAATIVTLVAAVLFSICFSKALAGFAKQINAFVKIGDLGNVFLQSFVTIFVICFVSYLFFVNLASAKFFRNWMSCCGTACILFFTSIFSQVFLISWVLVTCFVSALTLVYFIFIGSMYSFCALVDSQCLNFQVLVPAIVNRISDKQVDMTFCQDKKELICNRENNMIWNFGWAFLFSIVTFCGCLVVQNCVVYGLGKKNGKEQKRKTESVEMSELK